MDTAQQTCGGFLDALCIYGQVTHIRPEEMEEA